MKKVLIMANSAGGLYDFRNELVLRLLKEYQVVVSVPDKVRVKELEAEGVKVVHTDINRHGVNPVQDSKLFMAYVKLLKNEKPDVVLMYTIKPNVYGGAACRMLKIPYITTITGLGTTFQKEGMLKKLVVGMYKSGLKGASCVFFQNKENMQIFENLNIRGKASRLVSGSGVNLERHKFEEYPEEKDGIIKILYIGRSMKDKGTDELIETAEFFKKQSPTKVAFSILGYNDGDYEDKLKDCSDRGVLNLLGFDPEVHGYVKDCSAVVLPTYHEGMSNVLQEASAVGRPVIASDIPGCREIFDDGITGFSCKPRSSESLIEAVSKFISLSRDERKDMGLKARHKVEQEFDRNKVVDAYIEEIHKIVIQ